MRVPDTVIYHDKCMDGFTAAWIVWCQWGDYPNYVAGNYDVPPNPDDFRDKDVLILDFSYPSEALTDMWHIAKSIVVLDHHKTAQANLRDLPEFECGNFQSFETIFEDSGGLAVAFDMNRSGALMTWHFLHGNGSEAPQLVRFVNDRDLWRHELTGTKEVHAYITSFKPEFETWSMIANLLNQSEGRSKIFAEGASINRKLDKDMREIADTNTRFLSISGYGVPVCNMPGHMSSEAGHYLCNTWPDFAFAATYYINREGHAKFSLRGRGDFDVSAIAQSFGGGGHKNAAGFTIAADQVEWLVKPVEEPGGVDHYMNEAERAAYVS